MIYLKLISEYDIINFLISVNIISLTV